MNGATLAFVALTVMAVLWLWIAAAFRVVYGPRRPREGPTTSELRADPPAIVNLLTHDWTVTGSAPAATLLDLAERRVVDIIQVTPEQDIVQLRRGPREVLDLLPYERQVLDHLRRTAIAGVVPAAALTTGPASASDAWWTRFRRAVEKDARRRGLSQRRFPPAVIAGLGVGLGVVVLWLFIAFSTTKDAAPDNGPKLWSVLAAAGVVGASVLAATRFDRDRQRDTDDGLAAASHWLGVRRGYVDVGRYDELPPAAVILYERHLAYAAAMDVAERAIARLPLSAEDDRRGWSHHGGRWRQVVVRYPTWRVGWGQGPGRAMVSGLLWTATLLVPLYVLVQVGSTMRVDLEDFARSAGQVSDPASSLYDEQTADRIALAVTMVIGVVLLAIALNAIVRGMVRLGRGLLDAGRENFISGTVVRRRTWPHQRGTEQLEVDWVAIDDGTSDHLRAFVVRPSLAASLHQDDEVELSVTPFLGFVRSARVTTPARTLPPPQLVDQLPGPRLLPPVHWTERVGAPGVAGVEDEGPRCPTDVPIVTAVLARQIQRLFAAIGARR
jgi:Predicted membrane protein (DUF2207)